MDVARFAQTAFSGVANGALYAFVALGFALVSRSTGVINFAQGDLVMIGGVLTAALSHAGLPVALAVPLAALLTAGLSGALYYGAIRPATNATMAQITLITIGFAILLRGGVTMIWGSDPMAVPPFTGARPFDIGGLSILPQELWLIGTLVVVTIGTTLFFRKTVLGLALRAGAVNPLGASFVGIDHRRLAFVAFAAAGFLGGLGGAVWSPISYAQVDVGIGIGLKGFTAAILGGLNNPYGPIIGGIVLALVEAFSAGYLSSAYQDAITFGLLLLVLILRPQGLFGGRASLGKEEKPEEVLSTQGRTTGFTRRDLYRFAAGIIVLGGLGLVLNGTWLTSGIFAGIIAIVVMGLVLLTGYGGQLSLGQGAFMMIGAYSSGYLTVNEDWPPPLALIFGAALAALIALALGRAIFHLRGFYLSMASLGLLMIGLTFAREWTEVTGGPSGLPGISGFTLFGYGFATDRSYYFLVLGCSLLTLLFCLSITRSRVGRALLAVRSSELAARACGADTAGIKMRIFAVSAAIASIAGSLYVHYLSIANPAPFGLDTTIAQLTALTAGGFLSLWGAYAGSAVVVAIPLTIALIAGSTASQLIAGLQLLIFGLLLIVIVIAQSNGSWQRLKRMLRLRFGRSRPLSVAVVDSEPR